jgi:hypothetical protein
MNGLLPIPMMHVAMQYPCKFKSVLKARKQLLQNTRTLQLLEQYQEY